MIVDMEKCVGCGLCVPYCPADAISMQEGKAVIDLDKCFECGICKRNNTCIKDAFVQQTLGWPRYVRAVFSNVSIPSPNTGVPGRGTEEMKTNEVTGRFPPGKVGIAFEMGRPGIGTSMIDVEIISKVVVENGGELEVNNPTTFLYQDLKTGAVKPEFINERAMSVIIEALVDREQLATVLKAVKEVEHMIDTVYSIDVITMLEDGDIPIEDLIKEAGYTRRINGKTNVGLGKIYGEVM